MTASIRDLSYDLRTISPNDQMLDEGEASRAEYFKVGREALAVCKRALAGITPKRILDFPVGHGRVVRWFRNEWPDAEIFGVEIDEDALAFSSKQFRLTPQRSDVKLERTVLPGGLDLIFSGSLLTHFDEYQWDNYLRICADALAIGGILVFTTHGRVAAMQMDDRHPMYRNLIDTRPLYEEYLRTGFAYAPYSPEYPTYGLSLSSPSWIMSKVEKIPDLKIIGFQEQGWGQDVVMLRKNEWPMVR